MQKRSYLYSPFSEIEVHKESHRSLLIQFILQEIFSCKSLSQATITLNLFKKSSPFQEVSPFQKIREHAELLPFAFPEKKEETTIFCHALSNVIHLVYNYSKEKKEDCKEFHTKITSYLRQMFFLLEPFIEECKNDACLLFFLLSHHEDIALLVHTKQLILLLKKLSPEGILSLQEQICDHFHKKGFTYLIPEIQYLVKKVQAYE